MTTPKTDFDPAAALDLLDDAEAIITAYEALTGRSFLDDRDLRDRIENQNGSDPGLLLDTDNAMVAVYASGERVSIWNDDVTDEALYFKSVENAADLMETLGLTLPEEEPDGAPDGPVYYDGPSAAETYRQHWHMSVDLHS